MSKVGTMCGCSTFALVRIGPGCLIVIMCHKKVFSKVDLKPVSRRIRQGVGHCIVK